MMNEKEKHDERESMLCDYLDGQLGRARRREVEKQLEQDEPLREELRKYAALDGLLGSLAETEIDGFDYDQQKAEIVAAAERKALLSQKAKRRVLLFRPLPAGLAAAASVLLLVGVVFWLVGRPLGTSPVEPLPAGTQAVSVRVVPAGMADTNEAGTVYMKLSDVHGSEVASGRPQVGALPRGTVVVSSGAHSPDRSASVEPMMIY